MKSLHDLLRQKELAMKRLEKEIEAIRAVISMLAEETEQPDGVETRQAVGAPAVHPTATIPAGYYSAVSQNAPAEIPKRNGNWP
ncbi:MAG TPA: hypothetical protein VN622_09370 [Clostridia bacterium]|nr:hypothetical protein [Clostridia bacterium]